VIGADTGGAVGDTDGADAACTGGLPFAASASPCPNAWAGVCGAAPAVWGPAAAACVGSKAAGDTEGDDVLPNGLGVPPPDGPPEPPMPGTPGEPPEPPGDGAGGPAVGPRGTTGGAGEAGGTNGLGACAPIMSSGRAGTTAGSGTGAGGGSTLGAVRGATSPTRCGPTKGSAPCTGGGTGPGAERIPTSSPRAKVIGPPLANPSPLGCS